MDHARSRIRRSLEPQRDIISDLPRDVLYRIVVRLPLRDAARMSVLSRKWQDIWTSTPHLVFDAPFFRTVLKGEMHDTHKYCSIVSKILFQHEGPIPKFSLYVPPLLSRPDVGQWISYLSRNGLRDFSLCNDYDIPLMLSSRLFSCGGLGKLKLSCCIFCLPPNSGAFPKLTSLELDNVHLRYSTFKDVMGSCSALQKLVLTHCSGMEMMHVVIDGPNLRILVLDWAFESLEVKSCENLVSASIGMRTLVTIHHKANLRDLLKVVANSSKLERLCLGGYFCRVLFKECGLRNIFEKPKTLELLHLNLDDVDDLLSVLTCIQSFPSIQMLKICVCSSVHLDEHVLVYNSDCTLQHLRYAKFGISRASSTELKLIEVLLASSPVLEIFSVITTSPLKPSSQARMLVELNRFRRVSQNVEVICPEVIVSPNLPVPSEPAADTSSSPSQRSSSDSQFSEDSLNSD